MRVCLIFFIFMGLQSFAEDSSDRPAAPPTTIETNKMTTRDAKKSCKDEGKTGGDLVKCMKEKKEEK